MCGPNTGNTAITASLVHSFVLSARWSRTYSSSKFPVIWVRNKSFKTILIFKFRVDLVFFRQEGFNTVKAANETSPKPYHSLATLSRNICVRAVHFLREGTGTGGAWGTIASLWAMNNLHNCRRNFIKIRIWHFCTEGEFIKCPTFHTSVFSA